MIKTIAMCVALAFSTMTFAAETKTAVPVVDKKAKTASAVVAKKAPSFLFVLQAKQGKIETKDGKTFLVLKKTDIHHVIMFSDRPYRIVKYITGSDLAKDWKEGKDSFADDPPNAVLSSAGQKAQIVILESIQVKGDEVRFLVHGYFARIIKQIDIVVVIDPTRSQEMQAMRAEWERESSEEQQVRFDLLKECMQKYIKGKGVAFDEAAKRCGIESYNPFIPSVMR